MYKVTTITGLIALAALVAACSDPVGPPPTPELPRFAQFAPGAPSSGITLDQVNGTLGESGRILGKGFNPTNPHRGDAVVATFYWRGSAVIDSVVDVITDLNFTRVGNTYTRVDWSVLVATRWRPTLPQTSRTSRIPTPIPARETSLPYGLICRIRFRKVA